MRLKRPRNGLTDYGRGAVALVCPSRRPLPPFGSAAAGTRGVLRCGLFRRGVVTEIVACPQRGQHEEKQEKTTQCEKIENHLGASFATSAGRSLAADSPTTMNVFTFAELNLTSRVFHSDCLRVAVCIKVFQSRPVRGFVTGFSNRGRVVRWNRQHWLIHSQQPSD